MTVAIRRIIGLDVETFYSKEYSLRRLSTTQYVNNPLFKTHIWAVQELGEPAFALTHEQFIAWAADQDWSEIAIVGHNLVFDGTVLERQYRIRPALWIDTMGMAKAVLGPVIKSFSLDSVGEYLGLGGKLEKGKALADVMGVEHPSPEQIANLTYYAVEDIGLTMRIFEHLRPSFPGDLREGSNTGLGEYEILDWTIRCYTEPVVMIDRTMVGTAYQAESERREKLIAASGVQLAELRSDAKFAQLLIDRGIDPPRKVSKRTGKETWAFAKTDEEMTALLEDDDPVVRALVEARMGVKTSLVQTRLNSLDEHAVSNRNRFSVGIGFSGAHTHRFGAVGGGRKGGLNILNFPRDGDLNKTLVAPKGFLIANADSSQIECRLVLWQGDEVEPLAYLASGKDLYSSFASRVYGREIIKDNHPGERFVGKVGVLSLGYGASAPAFQNMVRIQGRAMNLPPEMWKLGDDFCKSVVQTYRRSYPGVPRTWKAADTALMYMADGQEPPADTMKGVQFTKTGYVLPSGLEVNYHGLRAEHGVSPDGKRKIKSFTYTRISKQFSSDRQRVYGASVTENVQQSLAREVIVAHQLPIINRELRVVWQVYDSIVCLIPEKYVDEYAGFIEDVMNSVPPWADGYKTRLPIACEVGVGKTYAEAKKHKWKRPS